MKSLLTKIAKKLLTYPHLKDKIFFVGNVSDEMLKFFIHTVDYCWLRYREIAQEASGIASLCFELGKNIILSIIGLKYHAHEHIKTLLNQHQIFIQNSLG